MQMLQRRGGLFQRNTVNAQRHNLRVVCQYGNHFRSGVPSLRCCASRRVSENHARARGWVLNSSASALISAKPGMVSQASRSAPASSSAFHRDGGTPETLRGYGHNRHDTPEPSAGNAPYGPTEPATSSVPACGSSARYASRALRASSTLLPISAFDCASSSPRAANPPE